MNSFLGDLWGIPLVRAVGVRSVPEVELWVLLDHEEVAVSKAILRQHWQQFERTLASSVRLHLIPLDRVDRDNLPILTIIFDRAGPHGTTGHP